MAIVRAGSPLDDAQLQSVFHSLRHDYSTDGVSHRGFSRSEAISRIFHRTDFELNHSPLLSSRRRASLRERFERARTNISTIPATDDQPERPGLDDSSLYALDRLHARAAAAEAALSDRLTQIAGRRGMSRREAREEFNALRAAAPGGRQRRMTEEERADFGTVMPTDPATRFALTEMQQRPPQRPPARLVNQWVGTSDGREVGVSDVSDRIEVRASDGTVTAWQCTTQGLRGVRNQLANGRVQAAAVDEATRTGRLIERAEQTAYRIRCDDCGQFTGETGHTCPVSRIYTYVRDEAATSDGATSLRAASPEAIIEALQHATDPATGYTRPVTTQIEWTSNNATVTGEVRVRPGDQTVRGDGTTRYAADLDQASDGDLLECSAHRGDSEGPCEHIDIARAALRQHLSSTGTLSVEEAQDAVRHALLVRDRTSEPVLGPDPATASTFSFVDDPSAFRDVILASGRDRNVDFYETDDALTGGYAANARFGIELEFDQNRAMVSRHLVGAGILSNGRQSPYHSGARSGYRDWVFESDGSVPSGGELVTPILEDNAESWRQLRTACYAIQEGGGQTHGAGSHTNIGAPDFTPEMAWRLATLLRNNQDDIYRFGRTRGSQRNMHYNSPNPDPGPRWLGPRDPYRIYTPREAMLNLTNAFASADRARIEFRFPDASHDPGVIQAQVRLCAALTNYVRTNDVEPLANPRLLGTARREPWHRDLMNRPVDEFAAHTEGVRTLIDELFTTDRERTQIAQLWGHGAYRSMHD